MSKIRINDLARELEVKSKAILDVLPLVGVTEKKTHSSSLEDYEAEKVRAHFQAAVAESQSASKSARAPSTEDGIKTKIDLSHISKPGDVLKLIHRQQAPPAAPPRPTAPPVVEKKPVPAAPPAAAAPSAPAAVPAKPTPPPPAPRLVVPQPRPPAPVVQPPPPPPPPAPTAPTVAAPVPPAPARPASPPPQPPPAESAGAAPSAAHSATPSGATPPRAPAPPPRRVIVPQTGPRPVYKAPPPAPAPSPAATGQTGAPARPLPGRPLPGRPVPGQPIFQRPRPGAPIGNRPPLRPGERRPMHPTRQSPMGSRPLGVGPGPGILPPGPTRPGSRPGGPSRRPGQRYIPRGVKEGPMKGYVPPPRMVVSNEPQPITRSITITEGISVKDLAEKLGIRAKDLIARLLVRGVFATINQTLDAELASEMARFFGADTNVITFEEEAAKEIADAAAADETAT